MTQIFARPRGGGSLVAESGRGNSAMELLRILCMLSIIQSHYYGHGINELINPPFFTFLPQFLAVTANAVFFLISGYYLEKTKFSFKRLILLVGEILFYNYILIAINVLVFDDRDIIAIINELFPITCNMNWFLSIYVFLYSIGPFTKKLCQSLRKHRLTYNSLVFLLFFFYSILGFITPENIYSTSIMQGFFIFILGDYICFSKDIYTKKRYKLVGFFAFFVAMVFTLCIRVLATRLSFLSVLGNHFIKGSSPLTIIFACSLVLIFSDMHFYSKLINILSSGTLAIYLIHDNDAFRNHIWFDILAIQNHLDHYVIYSFICMLLIYIVILPIDIVRRKTLERMVSNKLDAFFVRIQEKLIKIGVPY